MYDKSLYDKIQEMQLGDLVHLMLTEYNPNANTGVYMQSSVYYWACCCLNELSEKLSVNDLEHVEREHNA